METKTKKIRIPSKRPNSDATLEAIAKKAATRAFEDSRKRGLKIVFIKGNALVSISPGGHITHIRKIKRTSRQKPDLVRGSILKRKRHA